METKTKTKTNLKTKQKVPDFFKSQSKVILRQPCPVINCLNYIDILVQYYDPTESLNYTEYYCSVCQYMRVEIRQGEIKHLKRLHK